VETEPQDHIVRREPAAFGDLDCCDSERTAGFDGGFGRFRLGAQDLGKEERCDAVTQMATDQSSGIDEALVSRSDKATSEGEVVRCGESAGKW